MAEETSLRPGFNLELTFKGHLSQIRLVCRNSVTHRFFSCDDKTLKAWSLNRDGVTATVHHNTSFPGYQSTFITAMCVASDINMLFAACLDGNLRVYNEKLALKSCMPWSNGLVREMLYNKKRKEVITAGSYGVRVWSCDLDHEAYRHAKDLNPFDIPRTRDGQVVPWCFGVYQHAKLRLALTIPGAGSSGGGGGGGTSSGLGAAPSGGRGGPSPTPSSESSSQLGQQGGGTTWCDKAVLHEPTQTIFAIFQGSIYGFDLYDGTLTLRFQDLHAAPISSMAYLPEHEILVTSSVDSGGRCGG